VGEGGGSRQVLEKEIGDSHPFSGRWDDSVHGVFRRELIGDAWDCFAPLAMTL